MLYSRQKISASISRMPLWALIVLIPIATAFAALKNWTGSVDALWSTPGNWSGSIVPGTTDSVVFSGSAICSLSVTASVQDLIFSGYSGIFKFGNDTLRVSKEVSFFALTGSISFDPPAGLEFIGAAAQSFIPKSGVQLPALIQSGTGTVTVLGQGFKVKSLNLKNGTFNCGSGPGDTVLTLMQTEAGANLQLGSSSLRVNEVSCFAGNLNFQNGQLTVIGPSSTNFGFNNVSPGTGTLNLQQTGSWHMFLTPASGQLPRINKSGADSLVVSGVLHAQCLNLSGGAWDWGDWPGGHAAAHTVDTILTSSGARMYFSRSGPDSVLVSGPLNLSGLAPWSGIVGILGYGAFVLNGAGPQMLSPMVSYEVCDIRHTGTGVLTVFGNLWCNNFLQNGGPLNLNAFNIKATGNFSIANGRSSTMQGLGADSIAATSATLKGLPGDTLNLNPGSSWKLYVCGTLAVELAKISNCWASCSTGFANNSADAGANANWKFGKYWKASAADSLWTSSYNWAPPGVPQTTDSIIFDNYASKGCLLNTPATIRAITLMPSYGRPFNFGTANLAVTGVADFRSNGDIVAGNGALNLSGSTNQWFYPRPNDTLPPIFQIGPGTTQVAGSGYLCSPKISVINGTLSVFAGFNVDSVLVQSGATLQLDNATPYNDTIKSLWGGGSVDLGWANLNVVGDLNMASFSSVNAPVAAIKFIETSNKAFSPKSGAVIGGIEQINGITTVSTTGLVVNSLALIGGTFKCGAGVVDSISGPVSSTAGSIDFEDAVVKIANSSVDFSALNFTTGTATLVFCAMSGQNFTPKQNTMHPRLENKSGNLMVQTNRLLAPILKVTNGTVMMNTGFRVDSVIVSSGGSLDFGSGGYLDTVNSIHGTGSLYVNSAQVYVFNDLDLSGFTSVYTAPSTFVFLGSTSQTFKPSPLPPLINNLVQQGPGVTTVAGIGFKANYLTVNNGTFNLGSHITDSLWSNLSGNGTLAFSTCSLKVMSTSIDFSSLSALHADTGALWFSAAATQAFIPKAGALHPVIIQNGTAGTTVTTTSLKARGLFVKNGIFSFNDAAIFRDSLGSISSSGGTLDFGNDTVDAGGDVNFTGLTSINPGTGTLRFSGNAKQVFSPKPMTALAAIVLAHLDTVSQIGPLKCASFLQTSGTYNINGNIDTVVGGNFTIANGTHKSLLGLGGAGIVVQTGAASFSGQPGDFLNVNPGTTWRLDVPAGAKNASYANLANCNASGGTVGAPSHCAIGSGNVNWNSALVVPRLFDTIGTSGSINAAQRLNRGDTIDVSYKLLDADNAIDTIKMEFRNGISGSWTPTTSVFGDYGTVAASDSTVRRHIRWFCKPDLGTVFQTDSLQIRLSVHDAEGNTAVAIIPTATLHVVLNLPVVQSIVRFAPTTSTYIDVAQVTWKVTFSEPVFSVDIADFTLTNYNGLAGASIVSVNSVSSTVFDVNADAGSAGQGSLGLEVIASSATIVNGSGNNLVQNFSTGEMFSIDRAAPRNVSCVSPGQAAAGLPLTPQLVAQTPSDTGCGLHPTPYLFELATDSGFSTGIISSGWIASNVWSPPVALQGATVYYWHVKARDALLHESVFCGYTPDVAGFASFTTNTPPVAQSVQCSGKARIGGVLSGSYVYSDAESDPEGSTLLQWLRDGAVISGANGFTYTLISADSAKFISFRVTPAAVSGATPGPAITGAGIGPILDKNYPPNAPVIRSYNTASYTSDSMPALVVDVSDPNGPDTLKCQFQIGRDFAYNTLVADYIETSGAPGPRIGVVYKPQIPLVNGAYYWRARAMDADHDTGSWGVANNGLTAFIVAQTAPRLTVPHDSVISENLPWSATLTSYDLNGGVVYYGLVQNPRGFILDSMSGQCSWTPGYADIGVNAIVVVCRDALGNFTKDTFTLTVNAVKPSIVFKGDTIAREDSLFKMRLFVADMSPGDSVVFFNSVIAPWMKWSRDTLLGIPAASNVGKDTLALIALSKSGLSDTVITIITVVHTNHQPIIKSWTRSDSLYVLSPLTGLLIAEDVDAGDSLSLSWILKPDWLSATKTPAASPGQRFTFSGTPTQRDAGWVRYVFEIRDGLGASRIIRDSAYCIALPVTVIRKDLRKLSYGAVMYTVSASAASDSVVSFETVLRSLDDTAFSMVKKGSSGIFTFYPLADGLYEFTARAISVKGLRDPLPPRDTITVSGATRHVFSDTSWTMISVPSIASSAATIAGKGHVLHWDESAGEEDIYRYYRRESDIVQIAPGLSYWRKSADMVTITIKRQDLRDTVMNIRLNKGAYGWNQIASPYPYPVKWPYGATAWSWNDSAQDYNEADGILRPWEGYWVLADSTATVRLENTPVFPNATLAKRHETFFVNAQEWRIRALLKSASGNDKNTVFGFSGLAQDGFDSHDKAKPPRLANRPYAFLWHPEWKRGVKEFASDIRKHMAPINIFQIAIAPREGTADSARIRFEGVEDLSSIYCFWADQNAIAPIEPGKDYTVGQSASVMYKTVFVSSDKNFLKKYPFRFSMAMPYPNPCRPRATIQYALPYRFGKDGLLTVEPYTVKLALYDVMGRQVRQLVYRPQTPGMYHVEWDGKTTSGRIAASGAYLCRLEAGQYTAVTKLMMMK